MVSLILNEIMITFEGVNLTRGSGNQSNLTFGFYLLIMVRRVKIDKVNARANRVLSKVLLRVYDGQSCGRRFGVFQGHESIDHVEREISLQNLLLNVLRTGDDGIGRNL